MAPLRRALSPLGFVLVGLCFLLPFVTIGHASETERVAATWHGTDLTVGGKARLHLEELLWDERLQRYTMQDVSAELAPMLRAWVGDPLFVPSQPAFIGAALLVLLGVLAGVLAGAWSRAVTACAAGLAGAGMLAVGEWLALLRVDRFLTSDAAHAAATYGFWLAVGLLALLWAGNAVAAYRLRRRAGAAPPAEANPMTVLP
jgi:hypothetical protein